MLKSVPLKVQLVGHTVFVPPKVDGEGWQNYYEADESNHYWDVQPGGQDISLYDGQALVEFAGRVCYQSFHKPNPKTATNAGYLEHILETGHGSVLEHGSVSFYLTGISRSLTHELIRHRHFSFSELSQRFVNMADAAVVIPPLYREMLADNIESYGATGVVDKESITEVFYAPVSIVGAISAKSYEEMVKRGIKYLEDSGVTGFAARKQANQAARALMANMTETRMVITGNYRAWLGFLTKRDDPAADAEIRELAKEIHTQLSEHAPNIFGTVARETWENHGTLT